MKGKLGARIAGIICIVIGLMTRQSEQFQLDFQGMYVLVAGYGAIAVAFAGIR